MVIIMSNFKIKTVNFNQEELDKVFNNIKSSKCNVLYTNCIGRIKINDSYYLAKQFDNYFYSPENGMVILIEKDFVKTTQDVRAYLNNKNISYSEVRFTDLEDEIIKNDIPNITIVKEKQMLEEAIKDSKVKGYDSCTFYPQIDSELSIKYPDSTNTKLEQTNLKGLIIFPDKYIFMVNDFAPQTLGMNTVAGILINEDLNVNVIQEKFPQELLKEEKGSKVLCKKI